MDMRCDATDAPTAAASALLRTQRRLVGELITEVYERDGELQAVAWAGAALARARPHDDAAYSEAHVFDVIGDLSNWREEYQRWKGLLRPSCGPTPIVELHRALGHLLSELERRHVRLAALAEAGIALAMLDPDNPATHERAVFGLLQRSFGDRRHHAMIYEQIKGMQTSAG
jgi:hypothetical protein